MDIYDRILASDLNVEEKTWRIITVLNAMEEMQANRDAEMSGKLPVLSIKINKRKKSIC